MASGDEGKRQRKKAGEGARGRNGFGAFSPTSLSLEALWSASVKRWLLAVGILVLTGFLAGLSVPQSQRVLEPFLDAAYWRTWREWMHGFGLLAPLVSIGLSVLQVIPLPIPPPMLPLANGWLFGIWGGTLVTWLGVMINGMVGYSLARGPGNRVLRRWVPAAQLARAEQALGHHGALAVVVARLIPVLPFSAVSVAAGLLGVRDRDYLLATALGILPSAFALALIGYQLSRGALDWRQVALAAAILGGLALAGVPTARWLSR